MKGTKKDLTRGGSSQGTENTKKTRKKNDEGGYDALEPEEVIVSSIQGERKKEAKRLTVGSSGKGKVVGSTKEKPKEKEKVSRLTPNLSVEGGRRKGSSGSKSEELERNEKEQEQEEEQKEILHGASSVMMKDSVGGEGKSKKRLHYEKKKKKLRKKVDLGGGDSLHWFVRSPAPRHSLCLACKKSSTKEKKPGKEGASSANPPLFQNGGVISSTGWLMNPPPTSNMLTCVYCETTVHAKCMENLSVEEKVCGIGPEGGKAKLEFDDGSEPSFVGESVSPRSVAVVEEPEQDLGIDTPVGQFIAFVNSRSGESQGTTVLKKLQKILSPEQVFDLAPNGPEAGLLQNLETSDLRVIVCGGDGSVCWVHGLLDKLMPRSFPPVGVLPLGTGNDLARVLGFGGGYQNESLNKIMSDFKGSKVVMMDRWSIRCEQREPEENSAMDSYDWDDDDYPDPEEDSSSFDSMLSESSSAASCSSSAASGTDTENSLISDEEGSESGLELQESIEEVNPTITSSSLAGMIKGSHGGAPSSSSSSSSSLFLS
mmetsp:Transcript_14198/g.19654  ORF Transcript_14198/g.19654 Transcript_14198/m.19654 type:complete len:541 (-) Transcript_14198:331-1953(-)